MGVIPVVTVHIREVVGSSPIAPTFSPFLITPASMLNFPVRGGLA